MSDTMITVLCAKSKKAQKTNSTAGAYTAPLATVTRPAASATRAVLDLGQLQNPGSISVTPFGIATDGQTGSVLLFGWSQTVGGLFVPGFICEVQATFSGNLPGLAGQDVTAAMLFASTLSLTKGGAVLRQGTAGQDTASFEADNGGYELLELIWKIGTCTDINALVRLQ